MTIKHYNLYTENTDTIIKSVSAFTDADAIAQFEEAGLNIASHQIEIVDYIKGTVSRRVLIK